MKVWVAIWTNKRSKKVRVFSTQEAAVTWRGEIAQTHYDRNIGNEADDMPDLDNGFLRGLKYFALMERRGSASESFDIFEGNLDGLTFEVV